MTTRSPPCTTILLLGPPPSGRTRNFRVAPRLRTGMTASSSLFADGQRASRCRRCVAVPVHPQPRVRPAVVSRQDTGQVTHDRLRGFGHDGILGRQPRLGDHPGVDPARALLSGGLLHHHFMSSASPASQPWTWSTHEVSSSCSRVAAANVSSAATCRPPVRSRSGSGGLRSPRGSAGSLGDFLPCGASSRARPWTGRGRRLRVRRESRAIPAR